MVAAILDKLEVQKLFEASRKPDAAVAFYGTKNVLQSSVEKIPFYFFLATTIFIFVEGFRKKIRSNCKCFSFENLLSAKGAETSRNNRRNCA